MFSRISAPRQPTKRRGFTLIELMVSVAIIALLTGAGIAVYSMFKSKRAAINDAQMVANTLRDAHRRALAGLKPDACTNFQLNGYTVTINDNQLTLVALCPGGAPASEVVTLASGHVTAGTSSFVFAGVTGGVTSGSVDVCTENNLFRITVTNAGSISDPVSVAGGC